MYKLLLIALGDALGALFRCGEIGLGLTNIVVSNVAGLLLVFMSFVVARHALSISS